MAITNAIIWVFLSPGGLSQSITAHLLPPPVYPTTARQILPATARRGYKRKGAGWKH